MSTHGAQCLRTSLPDHGPFLLRGVAGCALGLALGLSPCAPLLSCSEIHCVGTGLSWALPARFYSPIMACEEVLS